MAKKPYELSIWKDIPAQGVYVQQDEEQIISYFDEQRVAIIGSHDFDSPLGAFDVSLKEGVNGEVTLTFSIYYKYTDKTGQLVDNPLFTLLSSEQKIKLREGEEYPYEEREDIDNENRWKDFFIKNIDKDSSKYLATITAKESYTTELGKNGWAVVLSPETTPNSYGTLPELAERVLKDSDWKVEDSYSPTEKIKEPLAKVEVLNAIVATHVLTKETVTIEAGEIIYPFYSQTVWKEENGVNVLSLEDEEIQFLWKENSEFTVNDIDDNRLVIDDELKYNYEINFSELKNNIGNLILTGSSLQNISLFGNRIEKACITIYEPKLEKYVKVYKLTEEGATQLSLPTSEKIYCFEDTSYPFTNIQSNHITNNSNFTSTNGWTNSNSSGASPQLKLFPSIQDFTSDVQSFNYLELQLGDNKYKNNGLKLTDFETVQGERYVVRFKGRWIKSGATSYGSDNIYENNSNLPGITFTIIGDYYGEGEKDGIYSDTITHQASFKPSLLNAERGYLNPKDANILERKIVNDSCVDSEGYGYLFLTANSSTQATKDFLYLEIGAVNAPAGYNYCLEEIYFFNEAYGLLTYTDDSGNTSIKEKALLFPTDPPSATVIYENIYYYIKDNEVYYLVNNESYYEPTFTDNYASVRNLEVKESNYFNNIQSLAELFEVWASFNVKHRKDGRVWLDEQFSPSKIVKFSQFSPNSNINYAGFKNGINVKNIKRTEDSNAIATKIIVKNNNQAYAINGSCSITRANSNPSGENEIYNFDYFIDQQLLDYNQVLRDLYGFTHDDLRYLPKLKTLNKEIIANQEKILSIESYLTNLDAQLTVYQAAITSLEQEINKLLATRDNYDPDDPVYNEYNQLAIKAKDSLNNYNNLCSIVSSNHNSAKTSQDEYEAIVEDLLGQKAELKKLFYKKYSRFIQEGTWTDENYIDDELYYLDAAKMAAVSGYPKVTYSIGAIEVEENTGFELYKFNIGDRTYLEDPEFFGYKDNLGTPKKIEVIVSERTRNLDNPSKSVLTVKNYKNQFEELFQKITATTQSLQYVEGEYARAASVITPTREIDVSTLELSFQNNALSLTDANNQSVQMDTGMGIEVANNDNLNERVRLIAGGLFISNDGGNTWTTGVTGNGINTELLTAGRIDTSKINLVSSGIPYFRWDTDGITSFYVDEVDGVATTYNPNKYVRYNQYGMYGSGEGIITINGVQKTLQQWLDDSNQNPSWLEKVKFIQKYASFSLTWDGIKLNGSTPGTGGGGSIETGDNVLISAIGGLEVFNGSTFTQDYLSKGEFIVGPDGFTYEVGDEIPIVSLGGFYDSLDGERQYGLRMRNSLGNVVLSTDKNGDFWVRESLNVGNSSEYYYKTGLIFPAGTTIASIITNYEGISLSILNNLNNTSYNVSDTLEEDTFLYLWENQGSYLQAGFYGLINTESQLEIISNIFGVEIEDNPKTHSDYSIRLWAGGDISTIENSNFLVLENGYLYAKQAKIAGEITSYGGSFQGKITIGSNNTVGIDGTTSVEPDYIRLWSGISEDGSYNFYITNDGTLFSKKAEIEGNIAVNQGIINESLLIDEGVSGLASNTDISLWINAKDLEDLTSSNFYVTKNGEVYLTDAYLRGSLTIEDNGTLYGINSEENAFWAGDYFYVDKIGNIYANSLELGSSLTANATNLTGSLTIKSKTNPDYFITLDGNSGSIYSGTQSGANWWAIEGNGTANFENVRVRGELETVVFKYNKVSAIGGTLFVSPSINTQVELLKTDNKFLIGQTNIDHSIWKPINEDFSSSSWSYINKVKIETGSGSYEAKIIEENSTEAGLIDRYIQAPSGEIQSLSKLPIGVNIISIDDTVNSIKLIAEDPLNISNAGPRFEMRGPQSEENPTTVFVGNLAGLLKNSDFSNVENPGYGLYTDNAYLTGKLYLPNAGVTNEDLEYDGTSIVESAPPSQAIRIWAGSDALNRANAPFVVTQDGSLYATKGEFRGTVVARDSEFSGWLQTTGILVDTESDTDNVLYVAYDNRDGSKDWIPTTNDKILQIDKNGLAIWEGGLKVYSDYASGWRGDEIVSVPIYLYGDTDSEQDPFPYIAAIDDQDFRIYSTAINIARFEESSFNGISINNGKLNFYSHAGISQEDISLFNDIESQVWNSIQNNWYLSAESENLIIKNDKIDTSINFEEENGIIKFNNDKGIITSLRNEVIEQLKIGEYVKIQPNENQGIDFYC